MSTIRVEHINPFINATVETFKSMVKTQVKPVRPILLRAAPMRYDVSGIIGLSGGARGTVALSFPRITALKMVSAFIGEKMLALDSGVVDAVGRWRVEHVLQPAELGDPGGMDPELVAQVEGQRSQHDPQVEAQPQQRQQ